MRKNILLVSVISLLALMVITAQVKAQPPTYVNFFVNDTNNSGFIAGVDPVGEYIYSRVTLTPLTVTVGDKRLTPVNNGQYAAASIVAAGDADVGKVLVAFKPTLIFEKHTENILVNALFEYGEYIYRDIGTGNTGTVGAGDLRLTNVGNYFAGTTVVAGDLDIGPALVVFKNTAPGREVHTENIETGGNYDPAKVFVDIMIDSDMTDGAPESMTGYGVKVQVDERYLVPYVFSSYVGVKLGYYLYDFSTVVGIAAPSAAVSTGPNYIDYAEFFAPPPEGMGAGNATGLEAKLVTLVFLSRSATQHSPLHIVFVDKLIGGDPGNLGQDGISDDWSTPDGFWHPATLIDGQYNLPIAPEFPLGITPLILLASAIPIVYLWRIRKRKVR
jgi:hypothetical protein